MVGSTLKLSSSPPRSAYRLDLGRPRVTRGRNVRPMRDERRLSLTELTVGLLAVTVLLGCSSSAVSSDASDSPASSTAVATASASSTHAETASPAEAPTPVPTVAATPRPTPVPLSVEVVALTRRVPQNADASISVRTASRARCDIVIEYASGPSDASGLEPKAATNARGIASWTWRVGPEHIHRCLAYHRHLQQEGSVCWHERQIQGCLRRPFPDSPIGSR